MAALPTIRSTIRRLIAPVALSAAIGMAVIGALVVIAAQELDRVAREDSVNLLASAISHTREKVKQVALEHSFWDQAVENLVKNFDRTWADTNIGPYLQDAFDICSTYVVDAKNRPVFASAKCKTKTDDPFVRFKGGLENLVDRARQSPRDKSPTPQEGLLWDGKYVHSVTASALTDFEIVDGKETPKGTDWLLIVTIAFHEETVSEISKNLLLTDLRIVRDENIGSQAHLPLQLVNGETASHLVWTPPQPGREMLVWTLPALFAVFVVLTGLTALFVRRANETGRHLENQADAVLDEKARSADYLDIAEIIIAALDLRGNITLINRKGCEVLGYSEDELIGENWFERVLPADESHEIKAMFREAFASKTERVLHRENHVTTKSGERRLISWQNSFVIGPNGQITGSLSSGQDITESRRAEEALRQKSAHIQAVLDNSSAGIHLKDIDGRFLLVNEKFAADLVDEKFTADFKPTPENIVGKTSHDLVQGKVADTFRAKDREVIETKSAISYEFEMKDKSGSPRVYISTRFPVLGDNGDIMGTGGISTEISEHAQAQAAAKKLQEELAHILRVGTVGEMATGIAHEVNQPLAAIKNYSMGMLRRLRSGGAEPQDMTRILELISEQAQRAGDLIRNVRRFAHREADGEDEIDVNAAIRDVASILTNEAVARDIRIDLDLNDDLPRIPGEAVQIQQAVLNLVRNGMDAMTDIEPDQTARLLNIRTARTDGDLIKISVADTGSGIPERVRARIFNPFFTTRPAGLGMGLSICRTIVKAHGGDIWFTSIPGEGTVFHLTLPILTEATRG
ncbi:MAG: PAS domain S-box protein [Rhodospirillales bacterium]|jgi:PAS domain S-box-containing protein|nr:PAS domain S-box protein [Rhodospirillales bacterium]